MADLSKLKGKIRIYPLSIGYQIMYSHSNGYLGNKFTETREERDSFLEELAGKKDIEFRLNLKEIFGRHKRV